MNPSPKRGAPPLSKDPGAYAATRRAVKFCVGSLRVDVPSTDRLTPRLAPAVAPVAVMVSPICARVKGGFRFTPEAGKSPTLRMPIVPVARLAYPEPDSPGSEFELTAERPFGLKTSTLPPP